MFYLSRKSILFLLCLHLLASDAFAEVHVSELENLYDFITIVDESRGEGEIKDAPEPKQCGKNDRKATAFCSSCLGHWHSGGETPSYPSNGRIEIRYTCGDAQSKADAINEILDMFGVRDICYGACPAGETCEPEGLLNDTGDSIDLKHDGSDPFCGYTVEWTATNGWVDFTPSVCSCM